MEQKKGHGKREEYCAKDKEGGKLKSGTIKGK